MRTKFIVISLILIGLPFKKAMACGPDFQSEDLMYYNLFLQSIVGQPYDRFRMQYSSSSYWYDGDDYEASQASKSNGNIKEWAHYLGISHADAYTLVFLTDEDDLKVMLDGRKPVNEQKSKNPFAFATPQFLKRHKPALRYLVEAKALEPYMQISADTTEEGSWSYQYGKTETSQNADKINFDKKANHLIQLWKATSEKELKLRYGYQLVRLAHYQRKYKEAVKLFDNYVQPLSNKPEMYYYALSQKAGAERGLGLSVSKFHFMQVFRNSQDLKETAFTSLFLDSDTKETDLASLLSMAQTDDERNDIYLLLGYRAFNNPLSEIRKITDKTPDAIQAKILMARAVNSIERAFLPGSSAYSLVAKDKRYPILQDSNTANFMDSTLALSNKVAKMATDRSFWQLSVAYLYFLKKDFAQAKRALALVTDTTQLYTEQKQLFAAYIDICEQPRITEDVENHIFAKYADLIKVKPTSEEQKYDYKYGYGYIYTRQGFIRNVLANRYYLQGDEAKAFLLTNGNITFVEYRPSETLVSSLERFYQKTDKNGFEQMLAKSATDSVNVKVNSYLAYVHGIVRLTKGDFRAANAFFEKGMYEIVSPKIFGFNFKEIGTSADDNEAGVMKTAYLKDFPFLATDSMNEQQLSAALMQLQAIGTKNDERAAKANYLIGNFYYNVSLTGFYRHYLRFEAINGSCFEKFSLPCYFRFYSEHSRLALVRRTQPDFFYVDYSDNIHYDNTTDLCYLYLKKAYRQAKNGDLRAHIAFALSKVEQEEWNEEHGDPYDDSGKNILISDRKYFAELAKYKNTKFYAAVRSHCKYFDYYVNHN